MISSIHRWVTRHSIINSGLCFHSSIFKILQSSPYISTCLCDFFSSSQVQPNRGAAHRFSCQRSTELGFVMTSHIVTSIQTSGSLKYYLTTYSKTEQTFQTKAKSCLRVACGAHSTCSCALRANNDGPATSRQEAFPAIVPRCFRLATFYYHTMYINRVSRFAISGVVCCLPSYSINGIHMLVKRHLHVDTPAGP